MLAKIYHEKSDFEEGFKWFKKAVEQGNFGVHFNEDDFFDFYLRDAQAGNVKSMLELGHLEYIRGNKVASSAWYERALDWDNPENIYDADTIRRIADWYRNGDDFIPVAQDESAAFLWHHRAADFFNDAGSMVILADIYRKKSEKYLAMARELDFVTDWILRAKENE